MSGTIPVWRESVGHGKCYSPPGSCYAWVTFHKPLSGLLIFMMESPNGAPYGWTVKIICEKIQSVYYCLPKIKCFNESIVSLAVTKASHSSGRHKAEVCYSYNQP
jgi:hypothetical protein